MRPDGPHGRKDLDQGLHRVRGQNHQPSRLCRHHLGYSDWATQDIASSHREMWYRISKNDPDFLLEHSYDGQAWQQMRVTHLHNLAEPIQAGVYACSPIGQDFWCRFKLLQISENEWSHEE